MNPIEKLMFVVCLILIMSVVPIVTEADEADSIRTGLTRENGLHPGMWALMFQIDEDLIPQAFDGMTIAMKRHSSRKSSFRLAFSLGLSVNETEGEGQYYREDTLRNDSDETRKANGMEFAVELMYVRYPWPDSYINAFWGLGPVVSFSRSKTESDRTREEPGYDSYEDYFYWFEESWSAGLMGIIGVEWFATRRISFHAEYQCVLKYRSVYRETREERSYYDAIDIGESTSKYWEFYGRGALFGVSLYF